MPFHPSLITCEISSLVNVMLIMMVCTLEIILIKCPSDHSLAYNYKGWCCRKWNIHLASFIVPQTFIMKLIGKRETFLTLHAPHFCQVLSPISRFFVEVQMQWYKLSWLPFYFIIKIVRCAICCLAVMLIQVPVAAKPWYALVFSQWLW